MTFMCSRSGHCCVSLAENDHWKRSHLTDAETIELEKTREQYPKLGKGCGMLVYDNGQAACLVEKEYGRKAKHSSCTDYPAVDKPCLRQILEMKDQRRVETHKAVMASYQRKSGKVWAAEQADHVIDVYEAQGKFDEPLTPDEEREAIDK